MKLIIEILLFFVAAALAYLIYSGIKKPIDFDKEKNARYARIITDLKDIRELQIAYKQKYQKYCNNIDSLISFAKDGELLMIIKVGDIEDSLAVARGQVTWDSVYVKVLAKLTEEKKLSPKFSLDSLRFIPFSGGQLYTMDAGRIMTPSKVEVDVFEASALNTQILKGMDEQLIINLNEEQEIRTGFKGLRVGSMTEANNNAGNWE